MGRQCPPWHNNGSSAHGVAFDSRTIFVFHDDVIKWKHFPRHWPFVRGNPRSSVNSPKKACDTELWFFSLISAWTNGWGSNRDAGDVRRHRAHCDVIVMLNQKTNFHGPKLIIFYNRDWDQRVIAGVFIFIVTSRDRINSFIVYSATIFWLSSVQVIFI